MRFRYLAALVAVALLVALPAVAQEQRASIEGVVKDAQGGAIVGASVVAKMASALETRGERVYGPGVEVVTDGTGTYRFASLSPGRYEIAATLSGFAPAKVQNIDLRLGQQLNINLTLQPGGVAETVQVVAESPLVAITQSARATSIRNEEIEKMPKGRDFSSLVLQAPGANMEDKTGSSAQNRPAGISIDGSSGGENRWIIDGAEATNIQRGYQGKTIVTDFVDEVQVKSSGYAAEYGGSTGGVINVLSKSGTNQWRGDALLYYQSEALDSDPRSSLRLSPTNDRVAEYVTYPKDEYDRWEPGFTLSGPLVRDKVWFFAGYVPQFRPLDRTVTFKSDGSTQTHREDYRSNYFSSNVTAQLGSQWRLRLAYNLSNQKYEGTLPAQDGTGSPTQDYGAPSYNYPNWAGSATLDFTPSNRVFMSLRGGYSFNNTETGGIYDKDRVIYYGSSVGVPGVPPQWQQLNGYQNVTTNSGTTRNEQSRFQLQYDTTFFFSGGGEHQMKVGVQMDRLGLNVLSGELGNLVRVRWNQALGGNRGTYGYYQVRSNAPYPNQGFITEGDVSTTNVGLFLQDSWTIGRRLTLNLGLRTENEHVPTFVKGDPSVPEYAIEWGFGKKLAPRAGFAWDVQGDGRTKVYGSWGIFYDIFKLELPLGSFGGDKWLEYYYTLDSGDLSGAVDSQSCPPACPGTLFRGPIDFRHVGLGADYLEPDLKPMQMQEFVVGAEREIASNLSVSARYVHKWLVRAIDDTGSLDAQGNEIYITANPGEGLTEIAHIFSDGSGTVAMPKPKRDYDGVELALNKRLSNNWSARVSYLWSRLYGNYSGLAQTDENGRNSPNVGRLYDYPVMMFQQDGQPSYGVLATDRTHQFKAQFLYDFNFGLSAGLNWYGASGLPRSREGAFIPGSNYPVMYLGRNSDGRLPFYNQADLYAQYRLRLGQRSALTFSANILNLFDQEAATNYFPTNFYGGAVNGSEDAFYRGQLDFQSLAQQQNVPTDARFLMDSGYQGVRQIRLGVKFSF
jgi:outer membrane receptor protein involved in Fe transport